VCMFIIPVIFYISTGLARCLVDLKISHDTRKLARTLRVIKNKKKIKNRRSHLSIVAKECQSFL